MTECNHEWREGLITDQVHCVKCQACASPVMSLLSKIKSLEEELIETQIAWDYDNSILSASIVAIDSMRELSKQKLVYASLLYTNFEKILHNYEVSCLEETKKWRKKTKLVSNPDSEPTSSEKVVTVKEGTRNTKTTNQKQQQKEQQKEHEPSGDKCVKCSGSVVPGSMMCRKCLNQNKK